MKGYDICEIHFRMQVYVDLLNPRNSKPTVSKGWLEEGIFIFLWPLRQNPDFLDKHKTPDCFPGIALLPSGRFPIYRKLLRPEAVFHNRERFHPPHDTWLWVARKYRPHHVLTISAFSLRDMIPNRWIKRRHSMAKIERAY